MQRREKVLVPWLFFLQVEQFWKFYSHMVRPGDLTGHSDFHLFKEGIKPMWEVRTFESRFVFFFFSSSNLSPTKMKTILKFSLEAVTLFDKFWKSVPLGKGTDAIACILGLWLQDDFKDGASLVTIVLL